VWALGDHRVHHPGHPNIEAEPRCSFYFVGNIEVRNRAAEKGEVLWVLQWNRLGVGEGKPSRVLDEVCVGERTARGCVNDLAVAGSAFGRGNAPSTRSRGNHELADLCSCLAEWIVAFPDRTASASSIGIVCLNDGDPGKINLGL